MTTCQKCGAFISYDSFTGPQTCSSCSAGYLVLVPPCPECERLKVEIAALAEQHQRDLGLLDVIEQVGVERDRLKAQLLDWQMGRGERLEAENAQLRATIDKGLDYEHHSSCGHVWTMRHTACPTCFAQLRADQRDGRKGVALIASALGESHPTDLSCVRLAEVAMQLRADLEAAHFVRDKIEHAKCRAAPPAAGGERACHQCRHQVIITDPGGTKGDKDYENAWCCVMPDSLSADELRMMGAPGAVNTLCEVLGNFCGAFAPREAGKETA